MIAAKATSLRQRPVLARVAAGALALLALFAAYPTVGITMSLVEFRVPLADVPRTEAFWSIGVVLLPYAFMFALAAFAVWKGWRVAHAASILITAWLVVSFVTSNRIYGGALTVGPFVLAVVALVALVASWRYFWKRRVTAPQPGTPSRST